MLITKLEDAIKSNPLIGEKVDNRIKFYQYPDSSDLDIGSYIVVDPLEPPTPREYADNKWLTEDQLFQIEVWSRNPIDGEGIANLIQKTLWNGLGCLNVGSGTKEYDKDLNVFRDARRYRVKAYVDSL